VVVFITTYVASCPVQLIIMKLINGGAVRWAKTILILSRIYEEEEL
jgi:hypothetical protein